MISKIIQKEKDRQENNFEWKNAVDCGECQIQISCHKQSLINLKEYLEDVIDNFDHDDYYKERVQVLDDIEELIKMIERYE